MDLKYLEYLNKNSEKIQIQVPADLYDYVEFLKEDLKDSYSLYELISFSLYQDKDAWRDLDFQLFRDDILRFFFDEESIKRERQNYDKNTSRD